MREFIWNLTLFAALSVAFSSLSACGGQGGTNNAEVSVAPPGGGASPEVVKERTPSPYPPLPAAVAQSDLKNLDGSTFKLADKKGKVVLVNMWATWCGPCRSEMPSLVRLQDKLRDKGFEIVGLDVDEEPVDQVNKFAEEMKLNYTLVFGDTAVQNELVKISKFGGIPQSFLIDRDGRLRGVFKAANAEVIEQLERRVEEAVNES